jgi:hypothetical protein
MALAGVFITWGFASQGIPAQQGQATLLSESGQFSEAMASSATSTTSAPVNPNVPGVVLSIAASAPIFFVVGPNAVPPTAPPTTGQPAARYYDPATGPLDIIVKGADKMAWVLA